VSTHRLCAGTERGAGSGRGRVLSEAAGTDHGTTMSQPAMRKREEKRQVSLRNDTIWHGMI
jgi:hypothetical protein